MTVLRPQKSTLIARRIWGIEKLQKYHTVIGSTSFKVVSPNDSHCGTALFAELAEIRQVWFSDTVTSIMKL